VTTDKGDQPRTVRRDAAVLDRVNRFLGRKTFMEAITRADIDDYIAAFIKTEWHRSLIHRAVINGSIVSIENMR